LKRENERVAEDVERERVHAEAKRLAEAERKKLELCAIKEREARERQEVEEAERAREEQVQRLAAIKNAEIERARIEAEARARLELERSRHEHEQKLAEIRRSVTRSSDRFAMVVSFVLLAVSALGGLVLYFAWLLPQWEQTRTEYEQKLAALETKTVESEQKLLLENRRSSELARELADLRSAKPASASPKAAPKPGPGSRLPPREGKGGRTKPCKERADGDPLDDCIP